MKAYSSDSSVNGPALRLNVECSNVERPNIERPNVECPNVECPNVECPNVERRMSKFG
jgi:hypothetical protein